MTDSFAAVYAHVQEAYPKLIWPQQWFSPNGSGTTVSMLSGTKDMLETLFLAVQRDLQPNFKANPFIHPCDVLFFNTVVDGTLYYRKSEMLSRYARQYTSNWSVWSGARHRRVHRRQCTAFGPEDT